MISTEMLDFLRDLAANNNKEWFHANKYRYQLVRKEFEQYVALLIAEIASFDESIKNLHPKDCIFRINREIRFARDKSPYKTNFGAFIAPGGRKGGYAGYYFHVEPANSFVEGGIYRPSSGSLKAIRTDIFENTEEFKEIIYDPDIVEQFGTIITDEKLKTAPKGFPKDFKDVDLLNYKDYTVLKPLEEDLLTSEHLTGALLEAFETVYPLNVFINEAIAFYARG
ncbi:MAG: DUF2461 domain-containing protein [Bacteroidales bacterium]|nr:DUF2461 domain-containing protein [Bacteroidales bacterium]